MRWSVTMLAVALGACRGSCENMPKPAGMRIVLEGRRVLAGGRVRAIAVVRDAAGRSLFAPKVTWSVAGPASVDRGFVAVSGTGTVAVTARAGAFSATATVAGVAAEDGHVLVDREAALQTMTGWEVTAQVGQMECDKETYERARQALYDRAVGELGIDRVRLEFRANVEHPVDWTRRFLDGEIDFEAWAKHRYVSKNDDPDPDHAERGAFQLTEIDHTMEHVVLPLAERLERRGEHLYLNACFVAFDADFHRDHPDEYAELTLVVFQHLQEKFGRVPDALEIILEPDVAGWSARDVARAVRAVVPRLAAAGFHPAIIAPSNTDMGAAIDFFGVLMADPEARDRVTDFSYHRYRGAVAENLETIGALPARFDVRTMMLEHIDASDAVLHDDLAVGNVSAWQRFALAFCPAEDDGSVHYLLGPPLRLARGSRMFPQYFRRVRLGAVRRFASASSPHHRPLAFENTGGRFTVIVRADRAGPIHIDGLPDGSYSAEYTTDAELLRPAPVLGSGGGGLAVSLPAPGVITVYRDPEE